MNTPTNIPIIIHHLGDQPYFRKCVAFNAKHNDVVILGDTSNLKTFQSNPKVKHVNIQYLRSPELEEFEQHFVNYSSNSAQLEYVCFQRIFILREFMRKYNYERVFYTDSDCIVLVNIADFLSAHPYIRCAISCVKNGNPFDMVGSIHNSVLNIEFCDAFIRLCQDIYVNKSKFHLIQPKIEWHKTNKVNGGICDMTLYYLIFSQNLVEGIADLNATHLYGNELCVFDHNINVMYGFEGENTYTRANGMKYLLAKPAAPNKVYAQTIRGEYIRLLSIHFQGTAAKSLLIRLDPDTFLA